MPRMPIAALLFLSTTIFIETTACADAKYFCFVDSNSFSHTRSTRQIGERRMLSRSTSRSASWWDAENDDVMKNFFGTTESKTKRNTEQRYTRKGSLESVQNTTPSLVTKEIEDEVRASTRATLDTNAVSRAISSLIQEESDYKKGIAFTSQKRGKNRLRDLATTTRVFNKKKQTSSTQSSWDVQQIAIASGTTTFLICPLIIPILHSILPPIIPSPSSISVTGAALLGAIAYIVALGDPTEQNSFSEMTGGGVLGESVEVSGALSRILGRTALQSVQSSAPRLKAAARALVDYEKESTSLDELKQAQDQLLQTLIELEIENDSLRRELSLWQAVEEVSNIYKLEELKDIARNHGIKGYSIDGKNSLLRKLVKEGILDII